ncbi:hypothetical protein B447_02606 [Thauera sp. 27]|uniref:hypothetical protein n=1 Tax=Thauera sp. 27 TaxID=305700 RepID=UPI0002CDA245|nr:hypothetical protein [Thauera sp. 27]ENO82872.1 hypothetical protein B447_02606 [Thauera sp. 27]
MDTAHTPTPAACKRARAIACTCIAIALLAPAGAYAAEIVTAAIGPGTEADHELELICSELKDSDHTRLVLRQLQPAAGAPAAITRFEIVTPEFLWPAPGQAESARFAAGLSDASPDLATALHFETLHDAAGALRLVDFHAIDPDAVAFEGLRGSLAMHEPWQDGRALGSLFYAGTGNRLQLVAVQCSRFVLARADD